MPVIGVIAGVFVGWVICAILGPSGHAESPNLWIWDSPGKIGCLVQVIILAVCGVIGFAIASNLE